MFRHRQETGQYTDDVESDTPHVVRGRTDTGEGDSAETERENNALDTGEVPNAETDTGSFETDVNDVPGTDMQQSTTNKEDDTAEDRMGRGAREKFTPAWQKDYYCKSTRIIHPKSRAHPEQSKSSLSGTRYPLINYVATDCFSHSHKSFVAKIDKISEPTYYHEAARSVEWREAMRKEIDALEGNGTWKVVNLPEGKKPIGCKWVYKIKYRADGEIERYKARLVAQGFTQVEGIDFHETYAPVAKMTSVRCMLAVAVMKGWLIEQLDVNNAFLHGDLDEEVYMKIPQGFERKGENKVCKLMKSIYGLKQASRNWFAKLTVAMKSYGFVQSLADYSLFTLNRDGVFIGVLVYVDDMIVVSNDKRACADFKAFLDKRFGIKDLGRLKFFLGIEVDHRTDELFLNQRKYAMSIVEESGMAGAKTAYTPIQPRHNLSLARGYVLKDIMKYRRLVGRLVYLTITRPDLVYAVHILSQFVNEPRKEHWEAALRVVRYIKRNPSKGIIYKKKADYQVKGYCDSDHAACPITRRSLSGYFVAIGESPISWRAKKQVTVATSTAEVEYRAMAGVTSELIWIKSFLASLGIFHTKPMKLYCDNQAAIHIAKNPVFHDRTKHIEIDCHFVRQHLVTNTINMFHVRSKEQIADMFTKALGGESFDHLQYKLGLGLPSAPT
ncbi:hypothetical protein vseg_021081 [Gypsophila vaccaria]